MKIIVDCMSGDNAPNEIIIGAIRGIGENSLLLVGDENIIKKCISDNSLSDKNVEIYHTDSPSVTMEDDPSVIIKEKKNSSMGTALSLLAKGEGDALVCAGNTGALFTGATLFVKRVKGQRRAALAAIVPVSNPVLVVDAGANIEVLAETLYDFACMGNLYAKHVMKIGNPRIGLLNNGAEETKGTKMHTEAYKLLKNGDFNFIGNVEGRDITADKCDVLVTDGFAGNIVVKLSEGFASFIKRSLKDIFFKNIRTKAAAVTVSPELKSLTKKVDYAKFGGAPLLGISKPVIKAHGSAKAQTIAVCVSQAADYASCGIIEQFSNISEKQNDSENI